MAITYAPATNIITVTGYSEATPANFTDVYNADKAGTLSLHARTGITAVDGAAVAVDRAERPADYIVLGGASNDLYITIANWVGTTATIQITGTDRAGNALTEDIVVTANGTYYTTKLFKTITHTQVTVFTATGFDYSLVQGQWGIVWKQSTNQFLLQSRLYVGDASTATWLTTIEEQITFETNGCGNNGYIIRILGYAVFTSGVLIDEPKRQGKRGSSIMVKITDIGDTNSRFIVYSSGIAYLYATHIACINTAGVQNWETLWINSFNSNCRVYQTIFTDCRSFATCTGADVQNLLWVGNRFALQVTYFSADSAYIWAFGGGYDIYTSSREDLGQPPLTNFYAEKISSYSAPAGYIGGLRNYLGSLPLPTPSWGGTPAAGVYNKWYADMDIHITDKDGNDIVGATITVKNTNNDQQFSVQTDANGEISETVYVTKDAWSGSGSSNTRTDYNPFTIEIKKAGYQTYKKKFTLLKKVDWLIRLRRITEINLSKRCRINM